MAISETKANFAEYEWNLLDINRNYGTRTNENDNILKYLM